MDATARDDRHRSRTSLRSGEPNAGEVDPDEPLYHLALVDEWEAALDAGRHYERSTVGRSLAEEGFIHTSLASQVNATAKAFYRGREVVLLTIDQHRVGSPILLEEVAEGHYFPHIHGPLPLAAVTAVAHVPVSAGGDHDFTGLLAGNSTH